MAAHPRDPSPGRFIRWAFFLTVPLVVAAVLLPRVSGWLGAAKGGLPTGALPPGAEAPGAVPAPEPPRREAPTVDEIEAARAARVEEARISKRVWEHAEVIAPREATALPDGTTVLPFQGFALDVETTPPGARLVVNGRALGQTPLVAQVDCRPGDPVEIRLELAGRKPHRRTVACRADTLLGLAVALSR